jgi:REP element-mobilizing transposase RayT
MGRKVMAKTTGYMVTWTTYGSWLQGDKRGYVKDGKTREENAQLERQNRGAQRQATVKLTKANREIIKGAIADEAKRLNQKVYAIAVYSSHVHLVLDYDKREIGELIRSYKNAAYFALRKNGFAGRVWTRGYDIRYCFDDESLKKRIDYVRRH